MERTTVARDLVASLLVEQFPEWADLPLRPVEQPGSDNVSFRLGDDMLVRLPSGAAYAPQIAKEQRWLPFLAPRLPRPIPEPLARGGPGRGYPWPWSIYRWLPGEIASTAAIADLRTFATELAEFLVALQSIDARDGPAPGEHSWFRGAPLTVYDAETRAAIASLAPVLDASRTLELWETGIASRWMGRPVWVHGDVTASNLIAGDGGLRGVIDFGCLAVGDPACDLAIAWTFFFGDSRDAFKARAGVDDATWTRARCWALWKALTMLATPNAPPEATARRLGWRAGPRETIDIVLDD